MSATPFEEVQATLGIPLRYRKARDLGKLSPTTSHFIHGGTGEGKTHTTASLANAFLEEGERKLKARGRDWSHELLVWGDVERDGRLPAYPLLFVSVAALIVEIKSTFRKDSRVGEEDVLRKYSRVPLLFLDDLGVQLDTDWSLSVLDQIVERRWNAEKHLTVTSNLSLEELYQKEGVARIASRIAGMCLSVVELKGKDRRL
jgi:DNA replication protein DnaC